MKKYCKKSTRLVLMFISVGMLFTLGVFFVLFGKGLQLLLPVILTAIFFVLFFVCDKIPFVRKHPLVKAIIAVIFIFLLYSIL